MKQRYTRLSSSPLLCIRSFGYSGHPQKTRWGRGSRAQYILHYILDGRGFFNGKELHDGQGFLITPEQNVEYHPCQTLPWTYFWVVFDGKKCAEICQNQLHSAEDGTFDFSFQGEFTLICKKLFSQGTLLSQTEALSMFFYLLSLHRSATVSLHSSYVEQAKNYMNLQYHRQLTIAEVAASLNISDRYLYNLFVKAEGCSPKQYLTRIRLQVSTHLLCESDLCIGEIATSVGFPDVLTFSKFFSKQIGVSPTAFRNNACLRNYICTPKC